MTTFFGKAAFFYFLLPLFCYLATIEGSNGLPQNRSSLTKAKTGRFVKVSIPQKNNTLPQVLSVPFGNLSLSCNISVLQTLINNSSLPQNGLPVTIGNLSQLCNITGLPLKKKTLKARKPTKNSLPQNKLHVNKEPNKVPGKSASNGLSQTGPPVKSQPTGAQTGRPTNVPGQPENNKRLSQNGLHQTNNVPLGIPNTNKNSFDPKMIVPMLKVIFDGVEHFIYIGKTGKLPATNIPFETQIPPGNISSAQTGPPVNVPGQLGNNKGLPETWFPTTNVKLPDLSENKDEYPDEYYEYYYEYYYDISEPSEIPEQSVKDKGPQYEYPNTNEPSEIPDPSAYYDYPQYEYPDIPDTNEPSEIPDPSAYYDYPQYEYPDTIGSSEIPDQSVKDEGPQYEYPDIPDTNEPSEIPDPSAYYDYPQYEYSDPIGLSEIPDQSVKDEGPQYEYPDIPDTNGPPEIPDQSINNEWPQYEYPDTIGPSEIPDPSAYDYPQYEYPDTNEPFEIPDQSANSGWPQYEYPDTSKILDQSAYNDWPQYEYPDTNGQFEIPDQSWNTDWSQNEYSDTNGAFEIPDQSWSYGSPYETEADYYG